jgi:C1A family cysteine protease
MRVRGYGQIQAADEATIKRVIAELGPVAVGVDSTNWSFTYYSDGIYDEPKCSPAKMDHAVIIVGYGTENGKDYWLIKNRYLAFN